MAHEARVCVTCALPVSEQDVVTIFFFISIVILLVIMIAIISLSENDHYNYCWSELDGLNAKYMSQDVILLLGA